MVCLLLQKLAYLPGAWRMYIPVSLPHIAASSEWPAKFPHSSLARPAAAQGLPSEVSPACGDQEGRESRARKKVGRGMGRGTPRFTGTLTAISFSHLLLFYPEQPSLIPSPPLLPSPSCLPPTHSSPMAWPQVSCQHCSLPFLDSMVPGSCSPVSHQQKSDLQLCSCPGHYSPAQTRPIFSSRP